jgi:hypothetical protein
MTINLGPINAGHRRSFGLMLGVAAIACLAACTTGQSTPPVSTAAAASLPTPGSPPMPKKRGVTIVAPYAPPAPPPEYIPPKPRGPDDGYFVWNPGHYHWDSTSPGFTYLPGGFVERPYQGSVWTNGAWNLSDGQWGWTPGSWQ